MISQSTVYNYTFFLQLTADLTPATGVTPAVQLSKAGAAFAAAAGAVTEIGLGWYKCALTTADTATLGDLAVVATAALCDPHYAKTQIGLAPVTATQNADALLDRDMSAVSETNARSPLNALRAIRNKVSRSGSTLTVTKENDSTSAWTATLTTDAAAVPITVVDPA